MRRASTSTVATKPVIISMESPTHRHAVPYGSSRNKRPSAKPTFLSGFCSQYNPVYNDFQEATKSSKEPLASPVAGHAIWDAIFHFLQRRVPLVDDVLLDWLGLDDFGNESYYDGWRRQQARARGGAVLAYVITEACIGTKDRKSTRLNSSHANISYAVFCL